MAHHSSKIREYCKANGVNKVSFIKDIELTDVNGTPTITQWNLDIPQPTLEQINSYEEVANETENNEANIKASAKAKLMSGEALTEEEADTIVL